MWQHCKDITSQSVRFFLKSLAFLTRSLVLSFIMTVQTIAHLRLKLSQSLTMFSLLYSPWDPHKLCWKKIVFLLKIFYFSICLTSNKLYWIEDQLFHVILSYKTNVSIHTCQCRILQKWQLVNFETRQNHLTLNTMFFITFITMSNNCFCPILFSLLFDWES